MYSTVLGWAATEVETYNEFITKPGGGGGEGQEFQEVECTTNCHNQLEDRNTNQALLQSPCLLDPDGLVEFSGAGNSLIDFQSESFVFSPKMSE